MKSKINKHKKNHENRVCKKHILHLGLLFIAVNAFSQTVPSLTENYVYTKTYLSKPGDPVQKPPMETIQYFDGLGRPKQVLNVKASPLGNDVVTKIEYDGFGRQTKDYLPVPQSGSSNGAIYSNPLANVTSTPYGTDKIYSEKVMENSPLDRILQQVQVGNAWSSKPVIFGYETNTASEVKKFVTTTTWVNGATSYALTQTVNYGAAQLYKNTVTDEDGNITIEFKNGEGQTLLVRKNDGTQNTDTYYVYDEYNQLAFVIPPLTAAKASLSQSNLDDLCYQYKYDGRNRLVEKKLPGKGWEYMVYDMADRLILTQDANLAQQGKWLISKYDKFGRVIYTGIIPGGDRLSMQNQINNLVITEQPSSTGFAKSGLTIYYTNNYFVSLDTILSVNYYDTYPSGTVFPTGDAILGVPILKDTFPQGVTQSTKSLPTASFVKNIEDDKWTKNYTFYDQKGRAIGSHSYNHLGGYTKTESALDFTGVPQKTLTYHKRLSTNNETIVEENFTYDNQNRLTRHTHQVNSNPVETLTLNHYNEIGQLDWKKVGGTTTALQTVDYKYNIRGWLSSVNDPANSTTMGTDLFGYRIRYNEPIAGLATPNVNFPSLQVKPKYNGNIAEIDWNAVESTGAAASDNPYRYGYVYDALNRLQAGFYQDPANPSKGTNNEIIEQYDLNGNIIKLKRFAYKPKSTVPAKIDDLTYTYTGGSNKVTNIADASGNTNGYEGGNGLIEYDANGNMTVMPDKGITNIAYNFLNLPKEIVQVNNTKYYYRADGTKIKKAFTLNNPDGSNTANTEYLDGFQYVTKSSIVADAFQKTDDNTLAAKTANEEETFVSRGDETLRPGDPTTMALSFFPTAEGFYDYENSKYIYQYKDHLGNVRLSYAKDATTNTIEVLDRNDYYPFGMNFVGYNSGFDAMGSLMNYKYNGKELQETGMYDFGSRQYMADIGRWITVDPLAEIGRRWTPYNYALDNPIRFIDPDGRWPYPVTTRSFAPFKSFGGWFGGDNRGFSTSSSVSSRLSHSYVMNTDNHTYTNYGASSSPSTHPLLGSATAKDDRGTITNASYTSNKDGSTTTSWTSTMAGHNPLVPGSPDIDVKTNFSLTENKSAGTLGVSVTQTGDAFPSAETMIGDTKGNQLMVGVSPASGDPYSSLPGDGDKAMMTNNFTVTMDENGVFTGVQQGDKTYSVGDWNKAMQSTPAVQQSDPNEQKKLNDMMDNGHKE